MIWRFAKGFGPDWCTTPRVSEGATFKNHEIQSHPWLVCCLNRDSRSRVAEQGSPRWVQVEANDELRGIVVEGANALPQVVVEEAFAKMHGRTFNFNSYRSALGKLNGWYMDRGIDGRVRPT